MFVTLSQFVTKVVVLKVHGHQKKKCDFYINVPMLDHKYFCLVVMMCIPGI